MKGRSKAFGQGFLARRLIPFLALLLAFFLWPSAAYADGCMPLILPLTRFTLFYTLALGAVEGILIGLVFRVRKIVALGVMVVANYASMLAGFVYLDQVRDFVFGHFMKGAPLYDMLRLQWILFGISFVLTLVLEWPFCWLTLSGKRGRWWKSILATGLAQSASYALLTPFFVYITEWGLYRQVDLDPSFVTSVSDKALVYFLSNEKGEVYRVRLNGQNREKVPTLETWAWGAVLSVRRAEDGKHVDLWGAVGGAGGGAIRMLLPQVGVLPFPDAYDDKGWEDWATDRWRYRAPVLDFRSARDRAWKVEEGWWGDRLISAKNESTGESLWLSFETPSFEWVARYISVIPGGKVVFQLESYLQLNGFAVTPSVYVPDQIVLLDLRSRKLGLITYGRSPVVVFPEQGASAADATKPD